MFISADTIQNEAFRECTNLVSVTFTSNVKSIGELAFIMCTNMESVDLPSSVTEIEYGAFGYCLGLNAVTFPANVKSIGSYAYAGCNNMESVTSLIKEPFEITEDVFMNVDMQTGETSFTKATLYVPYGTKVKYEATAAWDKFENIVEMEKTEDFGDVNGDGSVGIGDIVAVTNVMAGAGGDAEAAARADVNGDGSVGIGDIVAITNIMAGQQ